MKRGLGWTIILGLGGVLVTGCVSREEQEVKQEGQPYLFNERQPVPRERKPAPLGVGSGVDSARQMAMDQLKSNPKSESR